jgi:hypothetical protein
MPNRIIRDGLLSSDRYHEVGIEGRLLFFELLLTADDYGLISLSPVFLRMRCPTCSGKQKEFISKLIGELVDVDLLRRYESGGSAYGYIPRFGNTPRAKKPKYPTPPEGIGGNDINKLISEMHSRRCAYAMQMQANAPETETETETETEKPKTKTPGRGVRLPPDWRPTAELLAWAKQKRPDLDMPEVTDGFCDYWHSKSRDATKLDWNLAFCSWVRNQKHGQAKRVNDIFAGAK